MDGHRHRPGEGRPPAAPTGLTTSQVAHDSVTLTWTAPSRGTVTGYRVLRGVDTNSLSAIAADTGSTGTEYTDSTVAADTAYHYAVLALSQDGNGAQSTAVSATTPAEPQPPAAATGLTASQVAHDSVTLTWTDPEDTSITGYRILRGTDANSLSAIAQDTGSATAEYTDSTVAAETTYYYAVLALGADGDGARSATISATTPAEPQPPAAAAASLSLQGVSDLDFDPSQRRYRIHTPRGATSTQVDAAGAAGATVEIFSIQAGQPKTPVGRDSTLTRGAPSGTSVPLSQTVQTLVAVRVSTAGNEHQSIYTVKLIPPPGKGSGAATRAVANSAPRLSALSVSSGTLTPTFAAATLDYTVDVAHTVEQLTVAATAATGTSVVISAPDAASGAAGHQIALNAAQPGGNAAQTAFLVIVTNDTNIESYTVTVTRAAPPWTTPRSKRSASAQAASPRRSRPATPPTAHRSFHKTPGSPSPPPSRTAARRS